MYTKHIKQKLKLMLYDEADNLLESRMLKAVEVVSSGETFTFQAYLVDICEPKEGSKPSSDLTVVQPSDHGRERKPFAVLRPNVKKSSLHCEENKPNLVNKFSSKSLSPSHKMIRGTVPLGPANKESNNHPLINAPCDDAMLENDKLSKDVPPHKPLRDVNQILSILQRPNISVFNKITSRL